MHHKVTRAQLSQKGGGRGGAPALVATVAARPAKYLRVGEDGERHRAAVPAFREAAMHDGQRAWLRRLRQIGLRRDDDDIVVAEQRLIAEHLAEPARLQAGDDDALPLA